MLNKAMLIGRLGRDPEMKYTANGKAVTEFSVATDHGSGESRRTEWHHVICWERLAETCAQYLGKGRLVYVEGRIQTRSWDGPDGQKRYRTEIIADQVRFLERGDGDHESGPVVRADYEGDIDPGDLPF